MLGLTLKTVLAYLLGSLLGSLIVGKMRGGVDIRKLGSGNAGGTNALRTQGIWFALSVMVIDVGKGWFSAAILPQITLTGVLSSDPKLAAWTSIVCSTAVVVGHVYPIWFGFRGGKGAATLIGVVLGLHAYAAIPIMIIWLLVLFLTGYVGLATMIAAVGFPIYAKWILQSDPLFVFGLAMMLFVIYTHRGNLTRMYAGNENRAARVWLLRPR